MTCTCGHIEADHNEYGCMECGACQEFAEAPVLTADRTPHRGDPVLLYNDRRTVLDLIDRGSGLLVVAEDDAGLRIERYADRLTWDDDARAWRAVA